MIGSIIAGVGAAVQIGLGFVANKKANKAAKAQQSAYEEEVRVQQEARAYRTELSNTELWQQTRIAQLERNAQVTEIRESNRVGDIQGARDRRRAIRMALLETRTIMGAQGAQGVTDSSLQGQVRGSNNSNVSSQIGDQAFQTDVNLEFNERQLATGDKIEQSAQRIRNKALEINQKIQGIDTSSITAYNRAATRFRSQSNKFNFFGDSAAAIGDAAGKIYNAGGF